MQCFFCFSRLPQFKKFIECNKCFGFHSCEECWDNNSVVGGHSVAWLNRRKATLIELDAFEVRVNKREAYWDDLHKHSFDVSHAEWTTANTTYRKTSWEEYQLHRNWKGPLPASELHPDFVADAQSEDEDADEGPVQRKRKRKRTTSDSDSDRPHSPSPAASAASPAAALAAAASPAAALAAADDS